MELITSQTAIRFYPPDTQYPYPRYSLDDHQPPLPLEPADALTLKPGSESGFSVVLNTAELGTITEESLSTAMAFTAAWMEGLSSLETPQGPLPAPLEDHLIKHYAEYTASADLTIRVVTWNLHGVPLYNSSGKLLAQMFGPQNLDIYVIQFQETVPLTPQAPQIFGETPQQIWAARLLELLGSDYVLVGNTRLIGLTSLVLAKSAVARQISLVELQSVETGFLGVWGNKGAVSISVRVGTDPILSSSTAERTQQFARASAVEIIVVNCHLASGTELAMLIKRRRELREIQHRVRGLKRAGIRLVTDQRAEKSGADIDITLANQEEAKPPAVPPKDESVALKPPSPPPKGVTDGVSASEAKIAKVNTPKTNTPTSKMAEAKETEVVETRVEMREPQIEGDDESSELTEKQAPISAEGTEIATEGASELTETQKGETEDMETDVKMKAEGVRRAGLVEGVEAVVTPLQGADSSDSDRFSLGSDVSDGEEPDASFASLAGMTTLTVSSAPTSATQPGDDPRCPPAEEPSPFNVPRTPSVTDSLTRPMVFLSGDLNYRMNASVVPDTIRELIETRDFSRLALHDTLGQEVRDNQIFPSLVEGGLTFAPTYKLAVKPDTFDPITMEDDTHPDPEAEPLYYSESRVPAYTDRILYLPDERLQQTRYTSLETMAHLSDHIPVVADFTLKHDAVIDFNARELLMKRFFKKLDDQENENRPQGITVEPIDQECEGVRCGETTSTTFTLFNGGDVDIRFGIVYGDDTADKDERLENNQTVESYSFDDQGVRVWVEPAGGQVAHGELIVFKVTTRVPVGYPKSTFTGMYILRVFDGNDWFLSSTVGLKPTHFGKLLAQMSLSPGSIPQAIYTLAAYLIRHPHPEMFSSKLSYTTLLEAILRAAIDDDQLLEALPAVMEAIAEANAKSPGGGIRAVAKTLVLLLRCMDSDGGSVLCESETEALLEGMSPALVAALERSQKLAVSDTPQCPPDVLSYMLEALPASKANVMVYLMAFLRALGLNGCDVTELLHVFSDLLMKLPRSRKRDLGVTSRRLRYRRELVLRFSITE